MNQPTVSMMSRWRNTHTHIHIWWFFLNHYVIGLVITTWMTLSELSSTVTQEKLHIKMCLTLAGLHQGSWFGCHWWRHSVQWLAMGKRAVRCCDWHCWTGNIMTKLTSRTHPDPWTHHISWTSEGLTSWNLFSHVRNWIQSTSKLNERMISKSPAQPTWTVWTTQACLFW